jgi:hypothetical protein
MHRLASDSGIGSKTACHIMCVAYKGGYIGTCELRVLERNGILFLNWSSLARAYRLSLSTLTTTTTTGYRHHG